MKKLFSAVTLICFLTTIHAQDLITKTDGTVLKGKVVSYQDDRLIIHQDDDTQIIMPRKALAIIQFNYIENANVDTKTVVPKTEIITATAVPQPQIQQIKAPAPVVVAKNVVESPGEVSDLEGRKLMSAPALAQKPINSGRVTVSICVNTEGIVTSAKFKAAGSSTLDTDLISLAVENAKEFKFTKGKGEDCGLVTYKFNLE